MRTIWMETGEQRDKKQGPGETEAFASVWTETDNRERQRAANSYVRQD